MCWQKRTLHRYIPVATREARCPFSHVSENEQHYTPTPTFCCLKIGTCILECTGQASRLVVTLYPLLP